MKQIAIFLIILFSVVRLYATDYYLSNAGSDGNNGTSKGTPWATIFKLNTVTLVAGDRVFFRRGDSFYGSINVTGSGTSAKRITYGAYGNGALPVITGFTTLAQSMAFWTQISANVWETTAAVTNGLSANLNMVTINGNVQPMGRYPNMTVPYGSYLKFEGHSADSVITSTSLGNPATTGIDWTGAQIVIKSSEYTIDTAQILTHTYNVTTGSRLSFSSDKIYATGVQQLTNSFGYFIQNDIRTLDSQGEWYYNKATKKFRIYLTSHPSNYTIKIATQTYGMLNLSKDYITVENLRFEGFNWDCIRVDDVPFTDGALQKIFRNCEFQWARSAIWVEDGYSDYTMITGCKAWDMTCMGYYSRFAEQFTLRESHAERIALWPGMGALGYTGIGVFATAGNTVISNNNFINIGYIPIRADQSNLRIDSNYVNTFCLTHADGGGIYVGNLDKMFTNRQVRWNLVMNAVGNRYGTWLEPNGDTHASGIYLDDYAANVEVAYNTILNMSYTGFHFHNNRANNIHDNFVFGGGKYVVWFQTRVGKHNPGTEAAYRIWGFQFKNNTLIAKKSKEFIMRIQHNGPTSGGYINLMDEAQGAELGTNVNDNFNDNIYARPINQDSITFMVSWTGSGAVYYKNSEWVTAYGLDTRTTGTPMRFNSNANTDTVFYTYYNTGMNGDTVVTLNKTLVDMQGAVHFKGNRVTIKPRTGIVYMAQVQTSSNAMAGYYKAYDKSTKLKKNSRVDKIKSSNMRYTQQNMFTYSERMDHANWIFPGANLTLTANATTAPDGTATAVNIAEVDGGTGQKNFKQTVSVVQDSTYTLSCYVKDNGRSYFQLAMSSTGFAPTTYANFNLSTGRVAVQASSLLDARITSEGSGWYRVSITAKAMATTSGSTPNFTPIPANNASRLPFYKGVSGKNLYVWGAQFNNGTLKPYAKTMSAAIQ